MVRNIANHEYDLHGSSTANDAISLIERGVDANDPQALFTLASWLLIGQPLARDLPRARAMLRRAVTIGHVDAALLEIALTANGTGEIADWRGALALLQAAARHDPAAAKQLRLLDEMELSTAGEPTTLPPPRILAAVPDVQLFERFFTPQECAHIAQTAGDLLEPASIINPVTGRTMQHPIRSSDAAVIGPAREDLVIQALNRRIAAASGTDIDQGEALTVLRYRPGQQFKLHLDAIGHAKNQRVLTMLVYLNEGFRGGETHFPHAGLTVTPRGGDAILFVNADTDGRVDPASQHAGLPVQQGVKWLATRWIRARAFSPWTGPEIA